MLSVVKILEISPLKLMECVTFYNEIRLFHKDMLWNKNEHGFCRILMLIFPIFYFLERKCSIFLKVRIDKNNIQKYFREQTSHCKDKRANKKSRMNCFCLGSHVIIQINKLHKRLPRVFIPCCNFENYDRDQKFCNLTIAQFIDHLKNCP